MKKSVLLVDDIQMFIDIQKEFLQQSPVNILTARNGKEALEVVKAKRPHLVFMDLEMPTMDGAASCREIKSDPVTRATPVVMITSRTNQSSETLCYAAGCDVFLTKPLDRGKFLNTARKFMPDIERREKRTVVDVDCLVRFQADAVPGRITNLSNGGAHIAADCSILPGSVVRISCILPDGTAVESPCRVAWVNEKDRKGFGVIFSLMKMETRASLARFLESAG